MNFSKVALFTLIGASTSMGAICAPEYRAAANSSVQERVVLPLDHGPHAVSTPWLNQQKLLASSNVSKEHVHSTDSPRSPSDLIERQP